MDYVKFGNTGLSVSRLCLGCMTYGDPAWRPWVLDEAASKPLIEAALDAGINFFDTANMYSLGGSERVVGSILRNSGLPRDQLVIASKVYHSMSDRPNGRGLSRKHIMEQIDASLARLGMDYVDLYQIHRFDRETPVEETIDALNDVVRAGKALYIGASSMWAWQFAKMREMQKARGYATFVSMQNYYNLVGREEEREMMPYCAAEGVGTMPWSPLARGYLAGSGAGSNATMRARTDTVSDSLQIGSDEDETIRDRVAEIAAEIGAKPAQVALAWVLSKPYVTSPIVGMSKPHHLEDALGALTISLSAEQIDRLEAPYRTRPVLSHQ